MPCWEQRSQAIRLHTSDMEPLHAALRAAGWHVDEERARGSLRSFIVTQPYGGTVRPVWGGTVWHDGVGEIAVLRSNDDAEPLVHAISSVWVADRLRVACRKYQWTLAPVPGGYVMKKQGASIKVKVLPGGKVRMTTGSIPSAIHAQAGELLKSAAALLGGGPVTVEHEKPMEQHHHVHTHT